MERMKFCQSCRMPLSPSICGTEADGSPSQLYCTYCYQNGTFTENCTMEDLHQKDVLNDCEVLDSEWS